MAGHYVTTVQELSQVTGVSKPALFRHIQEPGFPAKGKQGWPVASVLQYMVKVSERDNAFKGTGQRGGLKDYKLAVEIKLLKAKLEQITGKLIPIDEVVALECAHAKEIKSTLDQWVEHAAALRDPSMLAKAQELRDKALHRLADWAEQLEDVKNNAANMTVEE